MHIKFLKIICDPETKENLKLVSEKKNGQFILSGYLISKSNKYRIVGGIPRFVKLKNYSANFGFQWSKWNKTQFESENLGKLMSGYTKKMFNQNTSLDKKNVKKKLILDMGCGSGRFTDILLRRNATVVAIDNSLSINNVKKNFLKQKNHIFCVQCDVLKLPFKEKVFDHSFSIGVLHHTPAPFKGVKEAFRVLKNKSTFSLCVYTKNGFYDFPSVIFLRKVINVLKPIFGLYPARIYTLIFVNFHFYLSKFSFILSKILKIFFPVIILPDKNWSYLDTFDSISPKYQSTHTEKEVKKWMKKSGFININKTSWGQTSIKAEKK